MFIAQPSYLNQEPDFQAVLLNQIALIAVAVPIVLQLPLVVTAFFGLMISARLLMLRFGMRKIPKAVLLLLLLIVVLVVLGQAGTFIGLQGGMSLLLLLGCLKSFEGYTRRDWQVSALVQIFLLAGAVLFDQSLWIGIWVLLCLTLIASGLAVLNEMSWKLAFKQSLTAFFLTLPLMVVLFVSMPRRDAPFWGVPQNPNQSSTTGISDSMKAGSIGNLVQNNQLAFTATFADGYMPQQSDLYWRVYVMGYRDHSNTWHALPNRPDYSYPDDDAPNIAYQIVLEDDKGRLPALDYPNKHQPQRGLMRESGNVLRVFSRQGVRGIQLMTSLSNTMPQKLNEQELNFYTKINENTNAKTRILAKQLFEQSDGDVETFIANTYQYFRKGFTYTLQPPVLSENNATDEFLFQSKQGFCEHYADAFVSIMRSAGVAARVVTGYQGGEWNGEFWQVRSKDAHAWTEVWLPEKQVWLRIDPTAAVSSNRIDMGLENALSQDELSSLLNNQNFFSQFADKSQVYWQRWVVNFDGAQQKNLLTLWVFRKLMV